MHPETAQRIPRHLKHLSELQVLQDKVQKQPMVYTHCQDRQVLTVREVLQIHSLLLSLELHLLLETELQITQ
jgi:hypothetical protein